MIQPFTTDERPITPNTCLDRRDPAYRTSTNGEITLIYRYPYYASDADEDRLVLVDGWQIAWCYRGTDGWISWGAAGCVPGHPTLQAAVDTQVKAFNADPEGYETAIRQAMARQEAERRQEQRRREHEEREWAKARRIRRLGTDKPGPTIARIPAYHLFLAEIDGRHEETVAVAEWLDVHNITADYHHEIRVERRATRDVIVVEQPTRGGRTSETWVVTLTSPMPAIATRPRPDLHALLEVHCPGIFPLINTGCYGCTACTQAGEWTAWPCHLVTDALVHPAAALQEV